MENKSQTEINKTEFMSDATLFKILTPTIVALIIWLGFGFYYSSQVTEKNIQNSVYSYNVVTDYLVKQDLKSNLPSIQMEMFKMGLLDYWYVLAIGVALSFSTYITLTKNASKPRPIPIPTTDEQNTKVG